MLRPVYDWIVRRAAQRDAVWWLAGVSFAESSFFPLPPDILLVPMTLANRQAAWWYALVCSASSVIGGLFGYAVGYFLFETIGRAIVDFYNMQESFLHFAELFNHYGAWILVLKGATPVPYKILTITAGFTNLDLTVFVLASLLSRSLRFFIVAVLLWYYGESIQNFIEKRLALVTTMMVVVVVGGFMAFKLF
ncbi:MAG TPA: YqaA family protein [Azospirillaceae bacterium]|nr:YqaA family protein [Azospirillaceae bacterium]